MIMTDVNDGTARRDGRRSSARASPRSRCSWPTRACSSSTTGRSSARMQRAGEIGALICMHAENGIPIDMLVAAGARQGPHRAHLPRAHAARGRRGRGHAPRDLPRRDGGGAGVHRAPLGASARSSRWSRRATAGCRPTPRRARSTSSSREDDLRASPARFEGAKYVCTPPLRPKQMQEDLWRGLRNARPPGGLDRPLPLLHEGPEGARARTTSPRSPTACRASRRASTCSGTAACAPGGSR